MTMSTLRGALQILFNRAEPFDNTSINTLRRSGYFDPSTSTGSIEGGEESNSDAAAINTCPTGPFEVPLASIVIGEGVEHTEAIA